MTKQETSPQCVGLCLGSILREITISKSDKSFFCTTHSSRGIDPLLASGIAQINVPNLFLLKTEKNNRNTFVISQKY